MPIKDPALIVREHIRYIYRRAQLTHRVTKEIAMDLSTNLIHIIISSCQRSLLGGVGGAVSAIAKREAAAPTHGMAEFRTLWSIA